MFKEQSTFKSTFNSIQYDLGVYDKQFILWIEFVMSFKQMPEAAWKQI